MAMGVRPSFQLAETETLELVVDVIKASSDGESGQFGENDVGQTGGDKRGCTVIAGWIGLGG